MKDNGGVANGGNDTGETQNFKIKILSSSLMQSITLKTGWNLISLHVHPDDMSPRNVFSDLLDVSGSNKLQKVVGDMKNFDPNFPDELNTLTNLTDGVGYWIKVSQPVMFSVTGRQISPDTAITLKPGWNNIGYRLQTPENIRTTLPGITGNANVEKVISEYEIFNSDVSDDQNTLKQLKPGSGYWIKVKED